MIIFLYNLYLLLFQIGEKQFNINLRAGILLFTAYVLFYGMGLIISIYNAATSRSYLVMLRLESYLLVVMALFMAV